ncbi:hypothetical protein RIF29_38188 [Crotalaria pallida]|uniref:MADS-box domain-containing protein n=1 Tax=Crotalaria pallida TaxID=3830 RepID=A0AAN9HS45_CROPI
MKKASELSVLCDAEVAIIIFSDSGKLYQFSSSDMKGTLSRYNECPEATLEEHETQGSPHYKDQEVRNGRNEAPKISQFYAKPANHYDLISWVYT